MRNAECGVRNEATLVARHRMSAVRIPQSALQLAARVGLAPTPNGLTGRRATLTLPGNGAADRIPTCIVPFRRRMPRVFGHGSTKMVPGCQVESCRLTARVLATESNVQLKNLQPATKKTGQRGRVCTCDPSVPGRVRWRLRYALMNGGPEGICTLNPPADNGALCSLELRVREMVGSAGNAPVVASDAILRRPGYSRVAGSLP